MAAKRHREIVEPATLSLAGHEQVVADAAGLRAALGDAPRLSHGETVSLRRDARHYIAAHRVERLWAPT